jgi:hypothetical protein
MSRISVNHGSANVDLVPLETRTIRGVSLSYTPRDLMDATASALLAVNTPQSVAWAHALYKLTADA